EDNVELLLERGKKYVAEKEYKKARQDYFKLIELTPDNAVPFFLLAELFSQKLKDNRKALTYYSQAIDRDKGKRNYYFKRGLIYFHQQEYEPAKTDFDAALNLSRDDGQILYYRGYCNQKLGHKEQAIEDYLRAKELAPSWTDAVNGLLQQMM
ncbi:MAG: tetratricopeptide repeat protein, partial [Desulfofustis sp.]|nr:tetratricopeptide repeat protein [Desulfofustis sp.]